MLCAPIPENEAERQAALDEHEIVDTEAEACFDALTRLAAHVVGTPMALVSIITHERQWFKSKLGVDGSETSRATSFCGHVVASGKPLVVADALQDPRFADNPYVTGEPNVRFYAGLPLGSEEGLVVGTLCVFDRSPRQLSAEALRLLELVAGQAAAQLQLRRKDRHLRRERRRLQASETRLRAVFEAMSEGVAIMDSDGILTRLNYSAELILSPAQLNLDEQQFEVRREDGSKFEPEDWPIRRALVSGERSSGTLMQLWRKDAAPAWISVNAARIQGTDSRPAAIATFHDITERVQAEALLRRSEASFRAVVASAPFGVFVVRQRVVHYVNDAVVRMFGHDDASGLVGQPVLELVHASSKPHSEQRLKVIESGSTPAPGVVECVRRDGSIFQVESTMVAVEFDGQPAHIALVRDVSEQLRAEDARQKAQEALRVSLAEKETLLQEVHHRVKNNLQVVASLINLQSRQVSDVGARGVLEATKQRVQAIALLHEGLYRSSDLASVELGPYLRGLAGDLLRANADPTRDIEVVCDAMGLCTNMDSAVPLGLIVNELVSNALKHAFRGRASGKVTVRLEQRAELAELRVSDDGAGLPGDFSFERADSLGLRLVTNLARQLEGELTQTSQGGVTWLLRFPLKAGVTPA
ncbi:MAG TPA: histidine kinase dimerization/phosphoacceptor domain -containing protein [Polyangiaceae bacterium]|nr:histidine kinase dimerization/phosphoacceptor domain -containing protein [Polyangiaceae bacterium]